MAAYAAERPFVSGSWVVIDEQPTRVDPRDLFQVSAARMTGPHPAIIVTRGELIASKQYQDRSTSIPWPEKFYMEGGTDRRHLPVEDKNKRHQIDWFRNGSYVSTMPDVEHHRRYGEPYPNDVDGTVSIARATFSELLVHGACAKFSELVDPVMKGLSRKGSPAERGAVKDTLRDLALFGILDRHPQPGGEPVFKIFV
jgi:hypothetical protein